MNKDDGFIHFNLIERFIVLGVAEFTSFILEIWLELTRNYYNHSIIIDEFKRIF